MVAEMGRWWCRREPPRIACVRGDHRGRNVTKTFERGNRALLSFAIGNQSTMPLSTVLDPCIKCIGLPTQAAVRRVRQQRVHTRIGLRDLSASADHCALGLRQYVECSGDTVTCCVGSRGVTARPVRVQCYARGMAHCSGWTQAIPDGKQEQAGGC